MNKFILSFAFFVSLSAQAAVYDCVALDKSVRVYKHVQIEVQNSFWNGTYIRFSDLNDGGHGSKFPYEGTALNYPVKGLPLGRYTVHGANLILEDALLDGAESGFAGYDIGGSIGTIIFSCAKE